MERFSFLSSSSIADLLALNLLLKFIQLTSVLKFCAKLMTAGNPRAEGTGRPRWAAEKRPERKPSSYENSSSSPPPPPPYFFLFSYGLRFLSSCLVLASTSTSFSSSASEEEEEEDEESSVSSTRGSW